MKEVLTPDRSHYVTENTKLVHLVLKRLKVPTRFYDDLYGAGCLGLTYAAIRFDEDKGHEFTTYAVSYIRGYILSEWNILEDSITGSSRARELRIQFQKYQSEHPELSDTEILTTLNINKSYWAYVVGDMQTTSLEELQLEVEWIPDEDSLESSDPKIDNLPQIIERVVGHSRESARGIYLDYINGIMSGNELTYEELGEKYGVSRQRAHQVIQKLNKKMQLYLKDYKR